MFDHPLIDNLDLRPWYVTLDHSQLLPDTEMWLSRIEPMFPGLPLLRRVEDGELDFQWPEFPDNLARWINGGAWPHGYNAAHVITYAKLTVQIIGNTASFERALRRMERIASKKWPPQRVNPWERTLAFLGLMRRERPLWQ